jgi:hypothetical protein
MHSVVAEFLSSFGGGDVVSAFLLLPAFLVCASALIPVAVVAYGVLMVIRHCSEHRHRSFAFPVQPRGFLFEQQKFGELPLVLDVPWGLDQVQCSDCFG